MDSGSDTVACIVLPGIVFWVFLVEALLVHQVVDILSLRSLHYLVVLLLSIWPIAPDSANNLRFAKSYWRLHGVRPKSSIQTFQYG